MPSPYDALLQAAPEPAQASSASPYDALLAAAPASSRYDQLLAAVKPPSPTPATDAAADPFQGTEPNFASPIEERVRAFAQNVGIPYTPEMVKEAGKFLIRNPIQDVKDIVAGAKEIPGKLANFKETLAGSPAATVARDPLSPEAFGVYGTAAGLLLPAAERVIRSEPSGVSRTPEVSGPAVGGQPVPETVPGSEVQGKPLSQEPPVTPEAVTPEAAQAQGTAETVGVQPEPTAAASEATVGTTEPAMATPEAAPEAGTPIEQMSPEQAHQARIAEITALSDEFGMTPKEGATSPERSQDSHAVEIAKAIMADKPVNAKAVKQYGMTVPENYVQEGNLLQPRGGEPNASSQPSAESVPEPAVRASVGEETPLRQQGETAPVQGDVRNGPAEPATQETVGISKAAIAEQRGARDLPDIERQKQIDFGTANDQANQIVANDPLAPTRLVDELAAKPRALNPEETPLLIRRVQETQAEFDRANKAVTDATTPAERTVAQDRLNAARAEYDKATEITQNATSKTGAGLNSLKMLLNEDYSLAKMESRRRAANAGQPLNPRQVRETADLHARIADLEQRVLNAEKLQATRQTFAKTIREGVAEARAAGQTKRGLVDFLDEKAAKARERIISRRGRLNAGFDPTALTDEIIIGASHIAKGLDKFGTWSDRMITDFGERIRPVLKDIWTRAKAYHNAAAKALRSPEQVKAERYKTVLAQRQVGLQAKLERGDFTKPTRAQRIEDRATFQMKANLQRLKNQFERAVANEAYKNKTPGQKFWDHFVGVERGMKLSGPEVFGKLGVAAAVREVLAPIESGAGYGVSRMFPKLAKGTRYGAGLGTVVKAEIKAKVALFTKGMAEAAENIKGKETELEAMGDKHGRGPEFWYHRVGKMHAAIKAPIKRAEFERSLAQRMDSAIRNGEDVSQPQVMARLANEAVLDANRAIFQQNTVVSKVFSSIEKASPAAGRVARFLFPVVKIPTNIFKEFVGLHVGAPVAATRIGMAYWKGVETLAPLQREAIIRQLVKGSVGGAGLLWAYYNHDKVQAFFKAVPTWFQHTPMAMVMNEGSYLWDLQHGTKTEVKDATSELKYMAKSGIPFMYTVSDAVDALNAHDSTALLKWINNMTQSTVVPQLSTQIAKNMDKPGTFPASMANRPTYRVARNPVEAIKLGIPGLRTTVPAHNLRTTSEKVPGMPKQRHTKVPSG